MPLFDRAIDIRTRNFGEGDDEVTAVMKQYLKAVRNALVY